jgi:hypothetical protein
MPCKKIIILIYVIFAISISLADPVIISSTNSTDLNSTDIITVNPTNSGSDQQNINDAIDMASRAGGGTVYLTEGIYILTGPVIIRSNVHLTGDQNAVLQVPPTSSQWFIGITGLISSYGPVNNVIISNFQIDGNCDSLPSDYADSEPKYDHDAERAIIINGYTNQFCNNIIIRNLKITDCFSDGIHIRFANNVWAHDNFISNCQHEGVFFTSIINGEICKNKIAGITSDNIRCDNCVNNKVYENILFSYQGSHSNGAHQNGQRAIQIANAGSSHNYDASNKPTKTANVEVFDNVFANGMLDTIWVHSLDESQVYLHDNRLIDGTELADMGIPMEDVDFYNMPSVEMSKSIFDSIFNILKIEYTNTGVTKHTEANIKYKVTETEQGAIAAGVKIVGFHNVTTIDGKPYISSPTDIIVKSSVVKKDPISDPYGAAYKFDKNITTKVENGTATATMKVTTKWYKKSKKQTSVYTFNDSCPAPNILQRPSKVSGTIFEYRGQGINYTKVSVNSTGLQRVVYNYDGNITEHTLMIGEKGTDPNGLPNVTFYTMDYWTGNLPHYAGSALINGTFDPTKLNVTAYTIYEEVPVNLDYKLVEWDGDSFDDTKTYLSLKIIIEILTIYGLFRILKH